MDLLALTGAVVGLALYPGALFLASATALMHATSARAGRLRDITPSGIVALLAAAGAAAMAPLPASPLAALPPPNGPPPNAAAAAIAAACAVVLIRRGHMSRAEAAVGIACLVALASLAAASASLSLPAISGQSAPLLLWARVAVAFGVLAAAPLLTGTLREESSVPRLAVTAALAVLALGIVVPHGLSGGAAALATLVVLAAVGVYGALLRLVAAAAGRHHGAVFVASTGALLAAVSLSVAGGH